MRDLRELDRYRIDAKGEWIGDEAHGWFVIPYRQPPHPKSQLRVIASGSLGWEHVSVSLMHRIPRYEEMMHVADLFFLPEECWVQYRVPKSAHINVHPHVLHWWRPLNVEIPLPDSWLV